MRFSESILRLAEEILPQTRLVFKRKKDADNSDYNSICSELMRFVDTVRGNEGLVTQFARLDSEDEMTLLIGFSNHEERAAVVREIERQARKLAKRKDIEVKVE